jgi:hypothetical protein
MAFTVVFLRVMDQAAAPSEIVEYKHKARTSCGCARRTFLEVFKAKFEHPSLSEKARAQLASVFSGAAVSGVFSASKHGTVQREVTKLRDIGNLTSWN